jgi:hypothetical protein
VSWQGAYVGACAGGSCGIGRPYAGYPGAYPSYGPTAYVGQGAAPVINPNVVPREDPNKVYYEAAIAGAAGAGLGWLLVKNAMGVVLGGAVGLAIPIVMLSMAKTA